MRKYKLLIFDFDGTLVDTAPDIIFHTNAILNEFGYPSHPDREVIKAVGWGVHELLKALENGFCKDPELLERAVTAFKQRYWDDPVITTKPYDHVREILGGALSGISKVIITNKPHALTEKILKHLNLESYFLMTIGIDFGFPAKPNPASVFHVMQKYEALPNQALYIGDSRVDAETAKNAGIDFAWVDYGYDELNGHAHAMRFSAPAEWKVLA